MAWDERKFLSEHIEALRVAILKKVRNNFIMVIIPYDGYDGPDKFGFMKQKQEALDGATDWLQANDLDDILTPGRLVQTLIPNTIHSSRPWRKMLYGCQFRRFGFN